jgi:hypothetical protein
MIKFFVMQFCHPPVTSCLLVSNFLLSTLFSTIRSLWSSLRVRDQVSHPYTTYNTGKGKVIPILLLSEHHAMKVWGSGSIAPRIL